MKCHNPKNILRDILLLFSLIILFCLPCCAPVDGQPVLTRIIDGDTIEVESGGVLYKVRYIGIDTPEMDDADPLLRELAEQAKEANRELLDDATLRLEKDVSETDRYGRLLRYVYADDLFVNAELVRMGLAWAKTYPPDTKYQPDFEDLEQEAQAQGAGIWQASVVSR